MKTPTSLNPEDSVIVTRDNIPLIESSLIRAYKSVFSASAWREGKKCAAWCGNKWTFEESPDECCKIPTIDYYSDNEVSKSIRTVLNKTYSQCIVLLDKNREVAGFTWWWQDTLPSINEEKLGLDAIAYKELSTQLENLGYDTDGQSWYYQSETGILPQYRGQGLGRQIVMINEALLQSNSDRISAIIQRTSQKSSMYTIRQELGYKEVYQYGDIDSRVLFTKKNN